MTQETEQKIEKILISDAQYVDQFSKRYGKSYNRLKKRDPCNESTLLSRPELLGIIERIKTKDFEKERMYKALIAGLFLSGFRVTELLSLKADQIGNENLYLNVWNAPTLKRRSSKIPKRAIFILKKYDHAFIQYFMDWVDEIKRRQNLLNTELRLFKISPARAWQICFKYTKKYSHYFRHLRTVDLLKTYKLSMPMLQKWMGWKELTTAKNYSHFVNQDLLDEILFKAGLQEGKQENGA
jgi:integrase